MFAKLIKPAALLAMACVMVGYFLFGSSFLSYLKTSGRAVQRAAQESVSVEFELQRARDLVDDILPQLQANVRLIAEEEVEIAALKKDIANSEQGLQQRQQQLARLRNQLEVSQVSYRVGHRELSRDHLAEQLSQQFARFREAELILDSKAELLETRQKSLRAAMMTNDRIRHQKLQLEQRIESLVAQHRLVKNASVGSKVATDGSKLTRADQLLAQIQRRLDISQRVLEHESDLQEIQLEDATIDESELLAEFDEYFSSEDSVDALDPSATPSPKRAAANVATRVASPESNSPSEGEALVVHQ